MQNLCGNTKEEIIKMLGALKEICASNICADCPFGNEEESCVFENFVPSDFRINEEDAIWRAPIKDEAFVQYLHKSFYLGVTRLKSYVDNFPKIQYNTYTIKKEVIQMNIKLDPVYVDHSTGEVYLSHKDAMAAYNGGATIDLYRNRGSELEFAVAWVH